MRKWWGRRRSSLRSKGKRKRKIINTKDLGDRKRRSPPRVNWGKAESCELGPGKSRLITKAKMATTKDNKQPRRPLVV